MRLWLVGSVVCLAETESLPIPSDWDLMSPTQSCLNTANCTLLWGLPGKQCASHLQLPAAPGPEPRAPRLPCPASLSSFLRPRMGEQDGWNGLEQLGNEGGLELREP